MWGTVRECASVYIRVRIGVGSCVSMCVFLCVCIRLYMAEDTCVYVCLCGHMYVCRFVDVWM